MNCRAKTLFSGLLLIAAILLLTQKSLSQSEELTSYPSIIYKTMTRLSKWAPNPDVTDKCKLTFSSPELTPAQCEANYNLSFLDNFKSKLFFDFDLSDAKKFQKVTFELKPNLKIRGLLALQNNNQKKPLVIFRMGIHGNIDEFLAERFLMKLIYKDLKYNVLVLESLTSHGFLKLNDRVTVGGFEEGLHTFYILNQITNGEFSWAKDITDIHLIGVSMSGAGVFLTTYLDEQNQHKIKSVQTFCPLINLQKTFEYHSKSGLSSAFGDLWNQQRLNALSAKNTDLEKISLWPMIFDLKPRFTPSAFDWLSKKEPKPLLDLQTIQKKFPKIKWPADFVAHIENSKSLYQLNDFWPIFKNQKTPIKIYVTPNDPAVINSLNTDRIRSGQQAGDFSKTKIIDLKGLHCALAAEYQWPFLVEMLRRGFLVQ